MAKKRSLITSCNVTSSESHDELLSLGAFSARLGNDKLVNGLDGPFEASKLHHGVGNLTTPQGNQRFVEAVDTLSGEDLGEGLPQGGGECSNGAGLNSDLDRLHGRQSNVSKKLGRCGGRQVKRSPVQESVLFSNCTGVDVLEKLVEAEFADTYCIKPSIIYLRYFIKNSTLGTVTKSSRSPTKEKSSGSTFLIGQFESISQTLVLFFVHLKTAFDQIKRGDCGVSDATRQKSSKAA